MQKIRIKNLQMTLKNTMSERICEKNLNLCLLIIRFLMYNENEIFYERNEIQIYGMCELNCIK